MTRLRNIALGMIVILNALATITAFGESYVGLFRWAGEHGVAGFWGGVWPMMVDLVILVAEAGLFVAHHDHWKTRHKAWLWSVMFTALGVSVGANTGHVHSSDWLSHLTASLPPVALMFTMTVGFGVMKRTFLNKPVSPTETPLSPASQPLTQFVRTSSERSHVGSQPWVESPLSETLSRASQPLSETVSITETPSVSPSESPLTERVSPGLPESLEPTETFAGADFKVTEKSYTAPRDSRPGLDLKSQRVRDMYDLDPEISVSAVAKALGIAWQTAKNYLDATKEARGLPA